MQYSLRNVFIACAAMLFVVLVMIFSIGFSSPPNEINIGNRGLLYLRIGLFVVAIFLSLTLFILFKNLRSMQMGLQASTMIDTAMQQALIEREKQLDLIYNATNDGILLLSLQGERFRINSANRAFLETYSVKRKQVIGKFVDEVTPPDIVNFYTRKLRTTIEERKIQEWESDFTLPSGRVTAEFSATPIIDKNGNCSTLVLTIHDITQRKKSEDKLRQAELRYRNVVEQSLIGVYIIRDSKFIYVNPFLASTFGYKAGELIDEDPLKIIVEEDKELVKENIIARLTGTQETIHYEARGKHRDGHTINIEIFCSGVLEEHNGAIIGTLLNITERKRAESQKEAALTELNERVKELTVLTKVSAILQEEEKPLTTILHDVVNTLPSGFRYFHLAEARIRFNSQEYVTANFKDGNKTVRAAFSLKEREVGTIEVMYRENGPVESNPFMREEENLVNMVAEMLRVFLSKKAEEEARLKMEQEIFNQRVQEQKKITRAVLTAQEGERNKIGQELHDNVNQILASVKLYLGIAMEKPAANEELVKKSHQMVMHAIEEIRNLSKTQVSPVKVIELRQLVSSLVERLDDSTSIKTSFDYNVPETTRMADDLKLNIYRIIQEQVNNVLKHSDATCLAIAIRTSNGYLMITIEDDGRGFDPSRISNGIGISNMMNRVESFNGKLTIDSSPGKGVRLFVSLPIEE